jgi:hypothetical protein
VAAAVGQQQQSLGTGQGPDRQRKAAATEEQHGTQQKKGSGAHSLDAATASESHTQPHSLPE